MILSKMRVVASFLLAAGVASANPVAVHEGDMPYPTIEPAGGQGNHGGQGGGQGGQTFGSASQFSVDLVRNRAYKRNGPAEYARAHAKYGRSLSAHMKAQFVEMRLTPVDGKGSQVLAWNQSYDREYLSPVYVGTPGQLCWMDLDTGSGDLWVFSSDTPTSLLAGQRIYYPELSRTAQTVPNATWSIGYGDGSYAGGAVYRDTVVLGDIYINGNSNSSSSNVTLFNVTVESATSVSQSLTNDPVMSGILGLSLNHPSTAYPRQPTLLENLAPPALDEYLFAVDLRYNAPGAYHFGYVNASAYTGEMVWRDVLPRSLFWEFHLQSIHIGGDSVWRMHDWPMVADTGTTLMLLPIDLVRLYWEQVPGAYLSEFLLGWVFPCNATLPDFDFGFDNGWNATIPGRYLNFQNISSHLCYGGIQESMEEFGILGDVFLKALYFVFDVANTRVGIAKKNLDVE